MKKLLAALLVMGTLPMTTTAFAADADEPQDATSKVDVTVEPGDTTDPVDPIDPPDEGEEGGETGNTGPLTIDYVSHLNFGTFKTGSSAVVLKANESVAKDPRVQVTDKRATGAGWTLQVAMEKAFSDGKHELKGAKLSLPVGELRSGNETLDNAPTAQAVVVNESAQTVMLAAKDQGLGTWLDTFAKDETTLTVPAGSYAGTYAGELTWTLVNAPS